MFWIFGCKACGALVPWSGIEPASSALQGGFLTTGPPAKSLSAGSCDSDVTINVSQPQAMDNTGASPGKTAKLGTEGWQAEPSWVVLGTLNFIPCAYSKIINFKQKYLLREASLESDLSQLLPLRVLWFSFMQCLIHFVTALGFVLLYFNSLKTFLFLAAHGGVL